MRGLDWVQKDEKERKEAEDSTKKLFAPPPWTRGKDYSSDPGSIPNFAPYTPPDGGGGDGVGGGDAPDGADDANRQERNDGGDRGNDQSDQSQRGQDGPADDEDGGRQEAAANWDERMKTNL